MVSEEFRDTLNEFENYVPFFRDVEKMSDEDIIGTGKKLSGQTHGVKKFEGSSRQIKPLEESVFEQARRVLDAGVRNVAMQRSVAMLSKLKLATPISVHSEKALVKADAIRKLAKENGIDVSELSEKERMLPLEVYLPYNPRDEQLRDNIVSVRVNGKLRFYEVADPELLVALKNFGTEKLSAAWKIFTAPKAALTWGVTHTPEFAIRNFLRDTGSNSILFGGKTIAPYVGRVLKSAAKVIGDDKVSARLRQSGAGGYWYNPTPKNVAKQHRGNKLVKKIGKYTVMPFSKIWKGYERVLSASEQANRVAVYEKATK